MESQAARGRRGNSEGSIGRRADGRWMGPVRLRDGTRQAAYGRSHAAVVAKLRTVVGLADRGVPQPSGTAKVEILGRCWRRLLGSVRRLYRVVRSNPPTDADFVSHRALGRRLPRRADAALIRAWDGVSTLTTRELAAEYARSVRLGEWIAELEVPDEVEADDGAIRKQGRHVDLYGATPGQLREYVV